MQRKMQTEMALQPQKVISNNQRRTRELVKLRTDLDEAKQLLASKQHLKDLCTKKNQEIKLLKEQVATLTADNKLPEPLDDSKKVTSLVHGLNTEQGKDTFKYKTVLSDYLPKNTYLTNSTSKKTRRLDTLRSELDEANRQLAYQNYLHDLCIEKDQEIEILKQQIETLTTKDMLPKPLHSIESKKETCWVPLAKGIFLIGNPVENINQKDDSQKEVNVAQKLSQEQLVTKLHEVKENKTAFHDNIQMQQEMKRDPQSLKVVSNNKNAKIINTLRTELAYHKNLCNKRDQEITMLKQQIETLTKGSQGELNTAYKLKQENFMADLQKERDMNADQNYQFHMLQVAHEDLKVTYKKSQEKFMAAQRRLESEYHRRLDILKQEYQTLHVANEELQLTYKKSQAQFTAEQKQQVAHEEVKAANKSSQAEQKKPGAEFQNLLDSMEHEHQKLQVAHEELKAAHKSSKDKFLARMKIEKQKKAHMDQKIEKLHELLEEVKAGHKVSHAKFMAERDRNVSMNNEFQELQELHEELKTAHKLSQDKFMADLQMERDRNVSQNNELQKLQELLAHKVSQEKAMADLQTERQTNTIHNYKFQKLQELHEELKATHKLSQNKVMADLQAAKNTIAVQKVKFQKLEVTHEELKATHKLSQDKIMADLQTAKNTIALQNNKFLKLQVSHEDLKMAHKLSQDKLMAELQTEKDRNSLQNKEFQKLQVSQKITQEQLLSQLLVEQEKNIFLDQEFQQQDIEIKEVTIRREDAENADNELPETEEVSEDKDPERKTSNWKQFRHSLGLKKPKSWKRRSKTYLHTTNSKHQIPNP